MSYVIEIPNFEMPHSKHEQHLCFLHNVGYVAKNLEEYKKLVRNARFVCKSCGRVGENAVNLCEPDKL
jgi:hypothetical protein